MINALALLLTAQGLPQPPAGPNLTPAFSVTSQRGDTVEVTMPGAVLPTEPIPLIVVLHNLAGNGPDVVDDLQLDGLQDQYNFMYCAPNGSEASPGGIRFWNATDACCNFYTGMPDDVAFLNHLINAIEAAFPVDPRRIHIIGYSNGGFMAHRMGCEASGRLASIAAIAGVNYNDDGDCVPAEPLHVLQVHSRQDNKVTYRPGQIRQGSGSSTLVDHPGAVGSANLWVMDNECRNAPKTLMDRLDFVDAAPGDDTLITRWASDCGNFNANLSGSVELWTVDRGYMPPDDPGHELDFNVAFTHQLVRHLLARRKPDFESNRFCSPAVENSTLAFARMDVSGSRAVVDNALTLSASQMPDGSTGYFIGSMTLAPMPVMQSGSVGYLCLSTGFAQFPSSSVLATGVTGSFSHTIDLNSIPPPHPMAMAGQTWYFQACYSDSVGGMTVSNLTDAIAVLLI